jgi:hypothetical protein
MYDRKEAPKVTGEPGDVYTFLSAVRGIKSELMKALDGTPAAPL